MSLAHDQHGSGEPLVLIHGLGGDRCVWDPVADALAERRDVIRLDLPGFGHSDALEDDPTPRALARAVLSPFVADPDRVPYREAWRMISAYARSTALEATSTAMRRGRFQGEVRVPVTLAFGELDRLISPATPGLPGAQRTVLPGCGHIAMWDDPDLVAGAIVGAAAALSPTAAG